MPAASALNKPGRCHPKSYAPDSPLPAVCKFAGAFVSILSLSRPFGEELRCENFGSGLGAQEGLRLTFHFLSLSLSLSLSLRLDE